MMNQLKLEYLSAMPERLEKISTSLENKDWTSLIEEFHKLKGTGKTYGFPEVSQLGELVEDLLNTKGSKNEKLVIFALDILKDIYHERNQQRELDLFSDKRFQTIKELDFF